MIVWIPFRFKVMERFILFLLIEHLSNLYINFY